MDNSSQRGPENDPAVLRALAEFYVDAAGEELNDRCAPPELRPYISELAAKRKMRGINGKAQLPRLSFILPMQSDGIWLRLPIEIGIAAIVAVLVSLLAVFM